jgi:hypothetical protein
MAYGDITGAVIDIEEYDPDMGSYAGCVRIADGVVAVVNNNSAGGIVHTYPIAADGTIGAMIDSWAFDTLYACAGYPQLISTGVVLLAYRSAANVLKVVTFSINPDGTINKSFIGSVVTALPVPIYVSGLAKKPGVNLCVAVWYDGDQDGQMATITFNSDGTGLAVADNWEFEPNRGFLPYVCYIGGNIFAVYYTDGGTSEYRVSTISIADDGTISESLIDTRSMAGVVGSMLKLSGDLVAITRRQSAVSLHGWIATHTIDNAGNISAEIDSLQFEGLDLGSSVLLSLGSDGGIDYVLVYWQDSSDDIGKIRSYSSNGAGSLTFIDSLDLTVNNTVVSSTNGAMIQPDIWVVVWQQTGSSDGYFQTVGIVTAPLGAPGSSGARMRGRIGRRLLTG